MGMHLPPDVERKILAALAPPLDVSERKFQGFVIDLLKLNSWDYYHTHDSRRSNSGFPDLACFRERSLFIELKTETGKLSPAQEKWQKILIAAGEKTYVFRPSDWPEIVRILSGK